MPDDQLITDEFGNYWQRCGPNCELEIVRPGKVQCNYCDTLCDFCGRNSVEFHLDPDSRWPGVAGWFCSNCGPFPLFVDDMDYLELEARKDGMWLHWCETEKVLLSVEVGEPCNWCGKWETQGRI